MAKVTITYDIEADSVCEAVKAITKLGLKPQTSVDLSNVKLGTLELDASAKDGER